VFSVGVFVFAANAFAGAPDDPLSSSDFDALSRSELAARAAAVDEGSDTARRVLLEWSERLTGTDDRAQLLDVLDRLYTAFPRDPEVRERCGSVWIQAAEWERLEPLLETMREPTAAPIEALREGVAAARANRLLDSLLLLQAAHQADPDDPRVLLNLGSFYCRFGRCEDGLALFQQITEQLPEDPYGYLAVAKAAKTLRDFETGTDALNRVEAIIRANPRYAERFSGEIESLWLAFVEMDSGSVSSGE